MSKNIRIISSIILLSLALISCEDNTTENLNVATEDETTIDSVATAPSFELINTSLGFQKLVLSDTAIIRGIGWESTLEQVGKVEDPKTLIEQNEDFYDYLITLDKKEQADVLYYYNDASQIQKIEINLYPADEQARMKYFNDFIGFFNYKYGFPSSEIEEVKIWKNEASSTYIEMRMLGNSKIKDLQIDIKNLSVNENF